LADEHGIDIVRYQVGRRICSLPPEVRAIFGKNPEVEECVREYQRGLKAGIVEWARGPSPKVPDDPPVSRPQAEPLSPSSKALSHGASETPRAFFRIGFPPRRRTGLFRQPFGDPRSDGV